MHNKRIDLKDTGNFYEGKINKISETLLKTELKYFSSDLLL